jgi:hypothetical protein
MSSTFDALVEAIQASGKKFNEIGKESIFAYLQKQGEPKSTWDSTYQKLNDMFTPTKKKSNLSSAGNSGTSMMVDTHVSVVDYSDSSHNDVKTRQPRKSIFSEIKKVAG